MTRRRRAVGFPAFEHAGVDGLWLRARLARREERGRVREAVLLERLGAALLGASLCRAIVACVTDGWAAASRLGLQPLGLGCSL